jgi:hypothetical protein
MKLPIGMNLSATNYYNPELVFIDVMKSASDWITFDVVNKTGGWSTNKLKLLDLRSDGYPTHLPQSIDSIETGVRFLINNYYKGRYVMTHDGMGNLSIHGVTHYDNPNGDGKILELTGEGGHVWFQIYASHKSDPIRNIRILPENEVYNDSHPFYQPYLDGLKPFHVLRFMGWMNINHSTQEAWEDRIPKDYYSQGTKRGSAIEYAVQLCNEMNVDPWFCVPHRASDNYIRNFAHLVYDTLKPRLKVYLEYSNEVWNWVFQQSLWVLNNAPDSVDYYVSANLKSISPESKHHPEKDAYMMQRTFKLWKEVYERNIYRDVRNAWKLITDFRQMIAAIRYWWAYKRNNDITKDRLITVATGQFAWKDNSRRILEYLFKKDMDGNPTDNPLHATSTGAGCDAFSVSGYFEFTKEDHEDWVVMNPDEVTPEMILDAVKLPYRNIQDNMMYANKFGVDYIVYEGGQHMQPHNQQVWGYNQAVYDSQIHPKMYDSIYLNALHHAMLGCKLFCAFSYVSPRESRWGSWGHLNSLDELKEPERLKETAPKYQAILDINL